MRGSKVIDHDFLLFIPTLSERAEHALHGFSTDALFRRRVRLHTADGDALPETMAMRLLMGFLPRRRVSSSDVCGSDGGRFNSVATFLSLLRVQLQERPPSSYMFHFGP